MLSTKSLISSIEEVPREWVFEFYLNLEEKLTGQDVKLKSKFNHADKNPSMYVYYAKTPGKYMFKDFSANKAGDGVTLVQALFNLTSRGEAAHKIIEDYNHFTLTNKEDYKLREFKIRQKYKVSHFDVRGWNTSDEKYWMKYMIGSKLLEQYHVSPFNQYTMTKEEDEEKKKLVIKGPRIYGYFRTDGTLYKIYQPMVRENKFIKVQDYIQGTDQLTMKVPFLVICSSLKDIMDFVKLGFNNAEAVAPDSENTLIPEHVIAAYRHKYKGVCTLFDIDEAGIKAMQTYKDKYSLPSVHLKMEKDLSDSVAAHGLHKVRETLTPLLKKALRG
jgi:hypothetical protein